MEKKYNIHLNPRRLTGQQIARHKNFDALLHQFNTQPKPRPILRRLIYTGMAIAAAVAGLIIVYYAGGNDFAKQEKAFFASQNYIAPPMESLKPTFASYSVNVNQGGVYEYPSGSKLVVAAATFVDENGNPVEGDVTLHYREMHDFVDFFLSGIPMTYDSAGVTYTLESAGMIEIFAEKDGKRVAMAPGKSIDVQLVSNVNVPPSINVPPGYNIYKLDEKKRNWVYTEIDRMEVLDNDINGETLDKDDPLYMAKKGLKDDMKRLETTRINELAKIESSVPKLAEPAKPQQANGSDYVFDLDFNDLKNANATGELAETQRELEALYKQYEKMLWQLSPKAEITPKQLRQQFSQVTDITIKKMNASDYELTLFNGNKSISIIANPVLAGTDYDKALTAFNKEYAVFQKQLEQRQSLLADQKAALQKRLDEERRLAQLRYEDKVAELKGKGMLAEATNEIIKRKVVNRFAATGFGIWNCDRPLPPLMVQLKADFKDQHGHVYKGQTAYLVDKSRNTVTRLLATDGTRLSFNRNSDNLLWLVTDDNKIAVFRPEDFKKIEKGQTNYTFVLHKLDKELSDEKDVREVLYL